MAHDVFISYSTIDKEMANEICHLLEQNGVKCWIAPRNIPVGEKYGTKIIEAIKDCPIFVLIFSENSAKAQWVESETNVAFSSKKMIIPYKIDKSTLEDYDEFYLMLNNRHWIESYPDFKSRFPELLSVVQNKLGREPKKSIIIDNKKDEVKIDEEQVTDIKQEEETPIIEIEKGSEIESSVDSESSIDNEKTVDETVTENITDKVVPADTEKKQTTKTKASKNKDGGCLWFSLAILSLLGMLGVGIFYGIKVESFWVGLEVSLVPGLCLAAIFLSIEMKDWIIGTVACLWITSVSIAVRIVQYFNFDLIWAILIGILIVILLIIIGFFIIGVFDRK